MANLTETSSFVSVYQLETSDPVMGGPGGISNRQSQELANRTKWLKDQVDALGLDKQVKSDVLTAMALLSISAANKMIYTTGANEFALSDITAFARTLLDDANAAAARATLGVQEALTAGVNIKNINGASILGEGNITITGGSGGGGDVIGPTTNQSGYVPLWNGTNSKTLGSGTPISDAGKSLIGMAITANKMPYSTGTDTYGTTTVSPFARTILDDTDASEMLTSLGVTTFIKTLLDDSSASAALTTLGVSTFVKGLLDDADAAAACATLGCAPIASPLFTGSPAGPTPPQFDDDVSLSTTAFVQRALGNRSGIFVVSGARTLSASSIGKLVVLTGTTYTLNLVSLTGLPDGSAIELMSVASGQITIQCSGSDTINRSNTQTDSSVKMNSGSTLALVKYGSDWMATSGSKQLEASYEFAVSLASSGYQRLPSGLIIQWGITSTGTGLNSAVTYPIAFPNGGLSVSTALANGTGSTWSRHHTGVVTGTTGFTVYAEVIQTSVSWVALGY